MNLLLSLCITTCICSSFQPNYFEDSLISLHITQQNFKNDRALLKVTITNHSSDTISYQSKSCSGYDYFTTNSKRWKLLTRENICFTNWWVTEKIPPHQSKDREIYITRTKTSLPVATFDVRLGFNFTPVQHAPDLASAKKMDKTPVVNKIIWSNAIIIHQ